MAKVQEVQWSNFGEQGSFGSFSDFFSVLPPDSSQQVGASDFPSHPEVDFDPQRNPTILGVGSNGAEPLDDNSSFFDLQQPHAESHVLEAEVSVRHSETGESEAEVPASHSETEVLKADFSSQISTAGQGPQSPGYDHFSQSELLDQSQRPDSHSQFDHNYWQNAELHGNQQSAQSTDLHPIERLPAESEGLVQQTTLVEPDRRLWQELAEYPGWLYNIHTGEWVEKNSSHAGAGADSFSNYSGQSPAQDPGGENPTSHWQGNEIGAISCVTTGQEGFSQADQSTVSTGLQNDRAGDQNKIVQTDVSLNPLSGGAVSQGWHVSSGDTASSQMSTSWEEQYPGWYYDYSSNEWKQYGESSQVGTQVATLLPEQQQQIDNSNSSSGGYNQTSWPSEQEQPYKPGQYTQEMYGGQNFGQASLQTNSQSSSQAQALGQWTGSQNQTFFNPASNHQLDQPGAIMANQHANSNWDLPYNVQSVVPTNLPVPMPEIPYTPYSTPQVSGYMPQPWPGMQPNDRNQYLPYSPQSPPKSVEEAMRTSVGRPPHVLTSFGFGGKLVILKLKDPVSLQSSDGNKSFASGQAFVSGPIHVHNLSQLVTQNADSGRGESGNLYFGALGRSSLSGPLVGGNFSNKELLKWLEDRAANCQLEEPNSRNHASLLMLWGLLKLACKHYGKLRSAPGSGGITSQEEDGPETALAQLLTSGGDQSSWTMGSAASPVSLQPMPSEHQLQVTAAETKKLLVAGKRKEALKHAQLGQLWGPALVLARQLGEKYYAETVAEMAHRQFLPGSPLRTLSLLLAGQPAEVFSGNTVNPSPLGTSSEAGLGSMLDEWQENLSIMAANRTNGDDRVISHLGDCLWKVKGEVASAHICYLVADAKFESFSSNARLCLIGADHWKNPRTYASPEAIQRTEVYEYSKFLGNPQYILVPFQPYKLLYSSMLAEAGKTAEALRYCQAVLKTLKTAGRDPEVEACRSAATSLEDRLRGHAQGGHSGNLAPGTLVRGLLSAIDKRIHGIIGGPPPFSSQEQVPPGITDEPVTLQDHLSIARLSASPTWSPAPLGPSASAEKINESGRSMPQRSVSEPDFSATMKEKADQGKSSTRGGYLGRFGSVFSKAGGIVSLVSKSSKNEAKLGDTNKFYYDEKLKKWVEEGAAVPQDEVLAPPPISSKFVNKAENSAPPDSQFGVGPAISSGSKSSAHLGTPPVPPSNQFSSRSRQQGVHSRYVDTFNKGGNSTPSKSTISTFAPAGRIGGTPLQPMNFFVPASSSHDNANGSAVESENGSITGFYEQKQVHPNLETPSDTEDRFSSNQHSVVQDLSHQRGIVDVSSYRVPTPNHSVGTDEVVQGSDKLANGDVGLSNGYHSRANSWSGYPSNFQIPQTEAKLSNDISPMNFSMQNGYSSKNAMSTPPTVASYFSSPPKSDIYKPRITSETPDSFLSPPPSITPFMASSIGEFLPRAAESSLTDTFLVGDELQEVEL